MAMVMSSVTTHYETLLARVYLWMAGGFEVAMRNGTSDLEDIRKEPGFAIDLGAGFGMHAIPLARAGYEVLAIDSSEYLLEQLRSYAAGLPIDTVAADLTRFKDHLPSSRPADLILCMGDTLTHLDSLDAVASLASDIVAVLSAGGRFVATFRDYTKLPEGPARFIPVRSDATRIHTCFLEAAGDKVVVHDILHEHARDGWSMQVSSYAKLRLDPEQVCRTFTRAGLRASIGPGPRGQLRLIAHQ
jgi:SAM-dependent methyltransferase